MDITPEKVLEIQQYAREPISLDQTIGDEAIRSSATSSRTPRPWWPSTRSASPAAGSRLQSVLETLSEREAGVGTAAFRPDRRSAPHSRRIGQVYGVTRERIRQIESKTMSKLRHPSRSQVLRDYLD